MTENQVRREPLRPDIRHQPRGGLSATHGGFMAAQVMMSVRVALGGGSRQLVAQANHPRHGGVSPQLDGFADGNHRVRRIGGVE